MTEEPEDPGINSENAGGAHSEQNFVRWFLCRFTTIAHFRRFIGTLILAVGVYYLAVNGSIPEQWTVFIGLVLGYYFGHNKESM